MNVSIISVRRRFLIAPSLYVSFKAPENLVVTIGNDLAVSKQVNVKAVRVAHCPWLLQQPPALYKVICLPCHRGYVLFPLLHEVERP